LKGALNSNVHVLGTFVDRNEAIYGQPSYERVGPKYPNCPNDPPTTYIFAFYDKIYIGDELPVFNSVQGLRFECTTFPTDAKDCPEWKEKATGNLVPALTITDGECGYSLCQEIDFNFKNPGINYPPCEGKFNYIPGLTPNLYGKELNGQTWYLHWREDRQAWFCGNDPSVFGCVYQPISYSLYQQTKGWVSDLQPGRVAEIAFSGQPANLACGGNNGASISLSSAKALSAMNPLCIDKKYCNQWGQMCDIGSTKPVINTNDGWLQSLLSSKRGISIVITFIVIEHIIVIALIACICKKIFIQKKQYKIVTYNTENPLKTNDV